MYIVLKNFRKDNFLEKDKFVLYANNIHGLVNYLYKEYKHILISDDSLDYYVTNLDVFPNTYESISRERLINFIKDYKKQYKFILLEDKKYDYFDLDIYPLSNVNNVLTLS